MFGTHLGEGGGNWVLYCMSIDFLCDFFFFLGGGVLGAVQN